MANEKPQNLENHARLYPPFHFFVAPVLLINVGGSIYRLVKFGISYSTVFGVLLALALFVFAFSARVFALTVQDRVIRLEMRLRLAEILPAELRPRIPEFTVGQLVCLRFACDSELPALARKVLDDKMDDRKAIKQLIKEWRADYLRA
ncbi:MAG TPA: DUF6526 family protein [Candidatus Acidoferrales bacterium]|jgi:hypothetical protein|nr:DUF6526 family protein [Candidatus Acidoferrales bacterium]